MPGFAIHYLFGERALPHLSDQRIRNRICRHIHSFCLGLQGPDVFYYSLAAYLPSSGNIGSTIHSRSTRDFLTALMESRSGLGSIEDRHIADAYICGFIGHYTLDTFCHPYVFYRTKHLQHEQAGQGIRDFSRHVFLETAMDQAAIRHFRNIRPTDFAPADTIALSRREQDVVSLLLQRAIARIFPDQAIPRWQARFAIHSMHLESALMHDPKGRKKALVRGIEQKILGQALLSPMIPSNTLSIYRDPCNLAHKPWHNPWNPDQVSRDSVYDLMNRADPVYCRRMQFYFRALVPQSSSQMASQARDRFLEDLGDCSYNSGLPLR